MDEFLLRWVKPFYLQFLHGNFAGLPPGQEQTAFDAAVRAALPHLAPAVVEQLLGGHWRESLTGSWFAGLLRWHQFTDAIGAALLLSRTCYAGQGYCFALARFADEASARWLGRYLDTYLARPELYYDQAWAMSALLWVDEQLGSAYGQRFLAPGGLWDAFVADKQTASGSWNLTWHRQHFAALMHYVETHLTTAA